MRQLLIQSTFSSREAAVLVGGPGPVSTAILSSDVTCLDLRLNLLSISEAVATACVQKERISTKGRVQNVKMEECETDEH